MKLGAIFLHMKSFLLKKNKKAKSICHLFRVRIIRRDFQINRADIARSTARFTLILVFVFGLIFGFDTRVRAEMDFGVLSANYNVSERAF